MEPQLPAEIWAYIWEIAEEKHKSEARLVYSRVISQIPKIVSSDGPLRLTKRNGTKAWIHCWEGGRYIRRREPTWNPDFGLIPIDAMLKLRRAYRGRSE